MCGIAGILSSDIDLRGEKFLVEKMGKTLKKKRSRCSRSLSYTGGGACSQAAFGNRC